MWSCIFMAEERHSIFSALIWLRMVIRTLKQLAIASRFTGNNFNFVILNATPYIFCISLNSLGIFSNIYVIYSLSNNNGFWGKTIQKYVITHICLHLTEKRRKTGQKPLQLLILNRNPIESKKMLQHFFVKNVFFE